MDKALDDISNGRLRDALVRLWVIAAWRTDDDFNLNAWERDTIEARFDRLYKNFRKLLNEGKSIGPAQARQEPLALVRALDDHIALDTPALSLKRVEHEVDSVKYWLVRLHAVRRTKAPYARQANNRAAWFICHAVIPANIESRGVSLLVRVRHADALTNERLRSCADEQSVRVYVAHFTDKVGIIWLANGTRKKFAKALTDEPARMVAINAHLESAAKADAHIVVFPELTVTPDQRAAVHRWQRNRFDDGNSGPILMLAGSFHERDSQRHINRAELSGLGVTLLTHIKIRPFGNARGIAEDIASGNTIQMLSTVLGLIAIPICKDFNDVAGVDWFQIGPDWCLVPSMGDDKSLHAHQAQAETLGKVAFSTISAIANQELESAPFPGFVYAGEHMPTATGGALVTVKIGETVR